MSHLQILPGAVKFCEWFNKSAENVHDAARLFHALLTDFTDVASRVAQITEVEHLGDFNCEDVADVLQDVGQKTA